jgi:predicted RNA methylase
VGAAAAPLDCAAVGSCCSPGDYDRIFTPASAESDARAYRRKGLGGEARRITREVKARGIAGRSVLEVGGGVGAIQVELLRAGASRATNVELSSAYEAAARRLLEDAHVADRATRHVADFVTGASRIGVADAVILQRVVCCYPDADALVSAAAAHARDVLVLTLPVRRWWMHFARVAINLWPRIRGSRFRFFLHRTATVVSAAERDGMRLEERHAGLVWQMLVFTRENVPA